MPEVKVYKKRPVPIEAMQYDGSKSSHGAIIKWVRGEGGVIGGDQGVIGIQTLEGVMRVRKGDYVIKGVQGEFYLCKPDIFAQTYGEVEDA